MIHLQYISKIQFTNKDEFTSNHNNYSCVQKTKNETKIWIVKMKTETGNFYKTKTETSQKKKTKTSQK